MKHRIRNCNGDFLEMLTVNENEYAKKIKVWDDEKISENRVLVTFSFSSPKVEIFFSFVHRFCTVSDVILQKRIRKVVLRFRFRGRQAMALEVQRSWRPGMKSASQRYKVKNYDIICATFPIFLFSKFYGLGLMWLTHIIF